jgi:hypothetical protein
MNARMHSILPAEKIVSTNYLQKIARKNTQKNTFKKQYPEKIP